MSPPQGLTPCITIARERLPLCKSGWSKGFALRTGLLLIAGKKVSRTLIASHQNLCPLGIGSACEERGEDSSFLHSALSLKYILSGFAPQRKVKEKKNPM